MPENLLKLWGNLKEEIKGYVKEEPRGINEYDSQEIYGGGRKMQTKTRKRQSNPKKTHKRPRKFYYKRMSKRRNKRGQKRNKTR